MTMNNAKAALISALTEWRDSGAPADYIAEAIEEMIKGHSVEHSGETDQQIRRRFRSYVRRDDNVEEI